FRHKKTNREARSRAPPDQGANLIPQASIFGKGVPPGSGSENRPAMVGVYRNLEKFCLLYWDGSGPGKGGSAVPRRRRSYRLLQALAVDRREGERADVHLVEAANVDRDHLRAVGGGAPGEGFDPAGRAEQMVDVLPAELVIGQRVLSRAELEPLRLDEGQQQAALRADRAVAGDDLLQVGLRFVADLAAVAAARIGPDIRHR